MVTIDNIMNIYIQMVKQTLRHEKRQDSRKHRRYYIRKPSDEYCFGGNSVAICVYLRKYRPSTHRTFICSLAIVDLATCCVPMPFILVTLKYPIVFQNNGGCKLLQFLTYVMCIASSMILLTIAAERYRKICVPHGIQNTCAFLIFS
ncbi:hypothetical protein ACJMK2_012990 [Sinanodonta woodiana]|uniref:G-protein coupled receptors family 1 profile domain-containing protein n=1 Tax=Sinanodonta woodiana TaxID=1069815 RepID=A0ABD3V9Y5_SINWO